RAVRAAELAAESVTRRREPPQEVRLSVGMRVTDLTGVEWAVRRRWLPRFSLPSLRERLRERRARSAERRGTGDSHWWDVFADRGRCRGATELHIRSAGRGRVAPLGEVRRRRARWA